MARKLRIHYPGALYHVMVRRNENKTVSEVIEKTKNQEITDIRKAIVFLSGKYCDISNKMLVGKLDLSASMISKIKSENKNTSKEVEIIMRRWEESK